MVARVEALMRGPVTPFAVRTLASGVAVMAQHAIHLHGESGNGGVVPLFNSMGDVGFSRKAPQNRIKPIPQAVSDGSSGVDEIGNVVADEREVSREGFDVA